jgi:hypothetical protein
MQITDVTLKLLHEAQAAMGPLGVMARRAAPATALKGSLIDTWNTLIDPRVDLVLEYVSTPLLYARLFRYKSKTFHRDVIRLLKGGFLLILRHDEDRESDVPVDPARRSSLSWYEIAANPEQTLELPSVRQI